MKLHIHKKAISPLIASVILIVFTMSIAALLTTWVQSITANQKESVDDSQDKINCFRSNMEIDNDFTKVDSLTNPTIFSARLKNTGQEDISIKYYRVWDNTTEPIMWKITDSNVNKTGIAKGNGLKIIINVSGLTYPDEFKKIKIETVCDGVYALIEKPTTGWREDSALTSTNMIAAEIE
ncbi:MAG: hypothetical protein KAR87_00515 [Candidatus Aenigmarchaeota archaeon]|nr:hypothetical protein [Candidatus Aenigmarchaeota archaeon]MCK5176400.1 hypothetical protein [Candidatus Aenigmarchaeota archaeon]